MAQAGVERSKGQGNMSSLTGKTLGNYRVMEQIGRGGMATVYKAYQPSLERYVAIKIIHELLAAQDEQFFKRFQREAKAVAALRHPNIVQVFDFGIEGNVPYMVMEYLEGRSLKAELNELSARGEKKTPEEILQIIQAVADAVDYASGQGMIHHDLKPDNVMLTSKGDVVLTDFGIAKIAGRTSVTVSGAVMGTPAYMSPEQGRGERGDERSDVYSLGVMLYEMATGQVPFEADTPLAVIFKHISDPLPLPRTLNPAISEAMEKVILKALAKLPDDRFQSTGVMANALAEAFAKEGTRRVQMPATAEPDQAPTLVAPQGEPLPTDVSTATRPPDQARPARRPFRLSVVPVWGWVLAVVALAALAVLLGSQTLNKLSVAEPTIPAAIGVEVTSTTEQTSIAPLSGPESDAQVSIDLGTINSEHGIGQFDEPDGLTSSKSIGGRQVRETAYNGMAARYIYFNVDDGFLFASEVPLAINVTYFDQGDHSFWIDYDSTDVTAEGAGVWKGTRLSVHLNDSREWKVATFMVPDAYFGGRQHHDADFRIATGDNELIVDLVRVSRLSLPPIEGPNPSDRVAAFYYPWYRNFSMDGEWVHWEGPEFQPPDDISSDYYPQLGPYSSVDPETVAQHFAWLRQAGVGLIIVSWWGQGSLEDQAASVLLEVGDLYGINVAFHIEPYSGRTAERLVDDVRYLYAQYGEHPAFYRTKGSSRWSPDDRDKGLFFVWSIESPDTSSAAVEAAYWREALDVIHESPEGGLVIANTIRTDWIDGGHFDGLYNYATLHLEDTDGFSWSRGLPPDAWYVPCVIPGFSARRIDYPEDTWVTRNDGETYNEQWAAALDTGVEPSLVAVTSFNEWHEGTQIEPAAVGATNGIGELYQDYSPLDPGAYLAITREWADTSRNMAWPATFRIRLRITTTSDWTTLNLVQGATWLRPSLVSASEDATNVGLEGDLFRLIQPLDRAQSGGKVEMVADVLLSDVPEDATVVFEIERGHLGSTTVELMNYLSNEPAIVETASWGGIRSTGRNYSRFEVPAGLFLRPAP